MMQLLGILALIVAWFFTFLCFPLPILLLTLCAFGIWAVNRNR